MPIALEQSQHEPVLGRFLSKNLAEVAIPVNADIPGDITIHFVEEVDEHAGPITRTSWCPDSPGASSAGGGGGGTECRTGCAPLA